MYDILDVTSYTAKDTNKPVFYWLKMLNQGDRIFATMTSDSHIVGERNGLRFVYVYTKKDNPIDIDPSEIALHAKRGHMVMSNGPFLKTDINGHIPGEECKNNGEALKMNVEVYGNNEIQIDRVQILINGKQEKTLNFTATSYPQLFTNGALQFKHSFNLDIAGNANVIVVATGKHLSSSTQKPFAVTNPIFIQP